LTRAGALHGIEHRLIPPGRPQTNGRVVGFNGHIADLLRSTRFQAAAELSTALEHSLKLYNGQIESLRGV
jgi:transposase InsO family protein